MHLNLSYSSPQGQHICKRGTNKPCYKIGYFEESWRKLNFEEAQRACRSDGGDLLSIESLAEQSLIEGFIQELKAADGDFWIGLRRKPNYEESSTDCESQYYWLDGSQSSFRSGHKKCIVYSIMYNCTTKYNSAVISGIMWYHFILGLFICFGTMLAIISCVLMCSSTEMIIFLYFFWISFIMRISDIEMR